LNRFYAEHGRHLVVTGTPVVLNVFFLENVDPIVNLLQVRPGRSLRVLLVLVLYVFVLDLGRINAVVKFRLGQ
jgi:hypothetical protein